MVRLSANVVTVNAHVNRVIKSELNDSDLQQTNFFCEHNVSLVKYVCAYVRVRAVICDMMGFVPTHGNEL